MCEINVLEIVCDSVAGGHDNVYSTMYYLYNGTIISILLIGFITTRIVFLNILIFICMMYNCGIIYTVTMTTCFVCKQNVFI